MKHMLIVSVADPVGNSSTPLVYVCAITYGTVYGFIYKPNLSK